jgi:hypothetical protein
MSGWWLALPICLSALIALGIYFWASRHQRREQVILKTTIHPVLGEVRHYRSRWETISNAPEWGRQITVSGDIAGDYPLEIHVETLKEIQKRYPAFLADCLVVANEMAKEMGIVLTTKDLCLDSIYLSGDQAGEFSLLYDIPAYEDKIPWGATGQYIDYTLEEFSDNH